MVTTAVATVVATAVATGVESLVEDLGAPAAETEAVSVKVVVEGPEAA